MGLASDLGYHYEPQNRFHALMARLFALKPMSWISYHVGYRLDVAVLRLTRGHETFTSWVTGLPVIWVTSTGARTGQLRTSPLLGIPIGSDLALVGSGFGQNRTPAWVYNLEADPRATVAYRSRSVGVVARAADPQQASEVWARATRLYPGYGHYLTRAAHREIRVFVLEPN